MKTITLYRGQEAIVDDEHYHLLKKHKWSLGSHRYPTTNIKVGDKYQTITMHRMIMPSQPGFHIDHINGDGLDNRTENLRYCTPKQNWRNRKINSNNISGYKGVHKVSKNRWQARIVIDGEKINLGLYPDLLLAAEAYDSAAIELYGEYANLNKKG